MNVIKERKIRIKKASERMSKSRTKDNMYNSLQLQEVFIAAQSYRDAQMWGRKK